MKTRNKLKHVPLLTILLLVMSSLCSGCNYQRSKNVVEPVTEDITITGEMDIANVSIGRILLRVIPELSTTLKTTIEEQLNAYQVVEENEVEETRYVDTYKVNVREEPTTHSDVLTTLVFADSVEVVSHVATDKDDEWVRVNMDNTTGYIMKEYTTTESPFVCIGYYHITWYCPCEKCCDVANRPTASGKMPTVGKTIAADKSLPFGMEVVIEGHTYTVEDRGGAINGNRIDIFVATHEEALSHKPRTVPVYARKYA